MYVKDCQFILYVPGNIKVYDKYFEEKPDICKHNPFTFCFSLTLNIKNKFLREDIYFSLTQTQIAKNDKKKKWIIL